MPASVEVAGSAHAGSVPNIKHAKDKVDGTVNVRLVPSTDGGAVIIPFPKVIPAWPSIMNLDPVSVTCVPTGPEAGFMPEIIGGRIIGAGVGATGGAGGGNPVPPPAALTRSR